MKNFKMYTYDHIGIPTKVKRPGMIYYPEYKVWTSDYEKCEFRIEWIFFEEGSEAPIMIRTIPHVCFIVKDIHRAVHGRKILLEPTHLENYLMAFIEHDGGPVEFLQMDKA